MAKLLKVTEGDLEFLRAEIKLAQEQMEPTRLIREKGENAYYRRPLGNEKPKRSQIVAADVYNQVEGLYPHLMRRFLATDHRVAISGPDPTTARALKSWARERINDQGGFRLISDVIKDGEISHNGTAKIYWSRIWGEPSEKVLQDQLERDIMGMDADPRFEILEVVALPRQVARQVVPADDHVSLVPAAFVEVKSAQTYAVRVRFTPLRESGPVISAMPPEEWVPAKGKVRMNDRKSCGHIRKMLAGELKREQERLSQPGLPYYRNLGDVLSTQTTVDASPITIDTTREDVERDRRESLHYTPDFPGRLAQWTTEELRREITIVEWCCYLVDGGNLVPAIVTIANGIVIRAEENEDGIIPYSTWSPIMSPHSIIGYPIAWAHADEQNIKTSLIRALLDSVAFSIDKPFFSRSRGVDVQAMQSLYPGKHVPGAPENYQAIDIAPVDYRIFQVIQFLNAEGQERGPINNYTLGTGSDSLNDTATGVSLIQRASFSRVDMIAMIFAESFLVDVYNKLIYLAQRNLDIPVQVQVDDKLVTLHRDMITGDYRARSDMGMDVDFDDRQFAKAQALLGAAMGVAKAYPPMFPMRVISEYFKDLLVASGKKELMKYYALPPGWEEWFPGAPPPGIPQAPPGALPPDPLGQTGTGMGGPQPEGRDFVTGQSTSQPDETMMGA